MSKNDPHILGKESIGKLLLQYSIPAIIGMTITSIYNIIGGRFYAGVYPSGAKGHEGGYGNLVTHVDALYH